MTKLEHITQRAQEEFVQKSKEWPKTEEELNDLIQHISKKHLPAYFHTALFIAKEQESIGTNIPTRKNGGIKTPIRMVLRNIEEHISNELFKLLNDN